MFQSGLVRFDTRTQTFRHFPVPAVLDSDAMQQSLVMPGRSHVDGKVWTNDVNRGAILRLDVASGNYELFDPFVGRKGTQHSPYGLAADAQNNLYFMDFADESIGRVDAKTGRSVIYPTPTPRSRPRRTMMDAQGRVWFAEFAANKVAMFDPARETFREWDAPTPHTYPYDVFLDRFGELWSGSMSSDRVLRFDPQSGAATEYLLPRPTNVRRVFVDDKAQPPSIWIGRQSWQPRSSGWSRSIKRRRCSGQVCLDTVAPWARWFAPTIVSENSIRPPGGIDAVGRQTRRRARTGKCGQAHAAHIRHLGSCGALRRRQGARRRDAQRLLDLARELCAPDDGGVRESFRHRREVRAFLLGRSARARHRREGKSAGRRSVRWPGRDLHGGAGQGRVRSLQVAVLGRIARPLQGQGDGLWTAISQTILSCS